MVRRTDFDPTVPLPPGLEISAIRRAVEYIERELADFIELYYEQANVFSALVGMFATKALDSVSNYEKHRHTYTAQQRFPESIEPGRPVIVWRVDVVFLQKDDYPFELSCPDAQNTTNSTRLRNILPH